MAGAAPRRLALVLALSLALPLPRGALALPSLLTIFGVHGFAASKQLVTCGTIAAATGALDWGALFATPSMFDSNVASFAADVGGAPAYLIPTGAPEGGGPYELITARLNGSVVRTVTVADADRYNLPFAEHLQLAAEPGALVALGEGFEHNLSVLAIDAETGKVEVLDAGDDLGFIMGFPPGVSGRINPGTPKGGAGGLFLFVAVVFGEDEGAAAAVAGETGAAARRGGGVKLSARGAAAAEARRASGASPAVQLNVLTVFDVAARRVVSMQNFSGLIQSVAGWDSAGLVVATLIPSNSSERGSVVTLDPLAADFRPLQTLFTFPAGTHPFMADSVVVGDTFVAVAQEDSPSFMNKLLVGDLAESPFRPKLLDFPFNDYAPWGAGSLGGLP